MPIYKVTSPMLHDGVQFLPDVPGQDRVELSQDLADRCGAVDPDPIEDAGPDADQGGEPPTPPAPDADQGDAPPAPPPAKGDGKGKSRKAAP